MVDFLEHLFQRTPPLAIDTIRGYRSALSSTLYNVLDLTNSVFLRNLLKNMALQCNKKLCPNWNLALVLPYITSPPFEPIMKASLWHLMLKTVFLLKLASGRHRKELHALSCNEKCYRFRAYRGLVTLSTEPGFLAKNQKPQGSTPRIVIVALGPAVGDHSDRKLCPVRALKAYLDRTKELEVLRGRTLLFLNPKKPDSDISPARIYTWIKKLVQDAHEHVEVEHLCLAKVSAHDVRKFSASWAPLTVHNLITLCKQHTGRARLPLPASISKQWQLKPRGCELWAPLWLPKQSSRPQALLRTRRRVFTLLCLSFHLGLSPLTLANSL